MELDENLIQLINLVLNLCIVKEPLLDNFPAYFKIKYTLNLKK